MTHKSGCRNIRGRAYNIPIDCYSFLVARTESKLKHVQDELVTRLTSEKGISSEEARSRVLYMTGDISSAEDLIKVRQKVVQGESRIRAFLFHLVSFDSVNGYDFKHADDFRLFGALGIEWGRLDTLHIISGVPSTQTIYQATGLDMVPTTSNRSASSPSPSSTTPARTHKFVTGGERDVSGDERSLPENDALKELEEEGMRLAAINMNGVVLSVGCFVSLVWCRLDLPLRCVIC